MATQYRYMVTSKWCGFWGGFGSERDIAQHIEQLTDQGWRLVDMEAHTSLWWWVLPRPKVLFVYERAFQPV